MRFFAKKLFGQEDGVVLVETLIALPVLILISLTFLEIGNMMWQRQQLQTGVKDAARYWARCRPATATGTSFMSCNIATARLIAFTGSPQGGPTRVPGWDDTSELTINPSAPPTSPTNSSLVTAQGSVQYQPTPWTSRLIPSGVTISYFHQTRYLGW